MKLDRSVWIILVFLSSVFGACEKPETPITLPPKGNAQVDRVDMGEDYENQIFYSLQNQQAVFTSKVSSWDLAFETDANGFHVFINGGENLFIYNTHKTDIASVKTGDAVALADTTWDFDAPCGLKDSTAVGDWSDSYGNSKMEIYMLKFSDNTYKKFVIKSVNNYNYVLAFGDIEANTLDTIVVPKDEQYNYSFFSFNNGGTIVYPEPPKNSWDIVFTRYRYIYTDLNNFPYLVNGVLLNPYNTYALADSSVTFPTLSYNASLSASAYSNHRDVIGFDWKMYNFNTGMYQVNPNKCYIVLNQNNQYWKIHFLDFYSPTGVKGSPSFEYVRIQ